MRLWIYNRTREINDSLIVFEWIFVPWLGAVKIKISNKLRLCPGTPIFNKNMSRCLIWSAYSRQCHCVLASYIEERLHRCIACQTDMLRVMSEDSGHLLKFNINGINKPDWVIKQQENNCSCYVTINDNLTKPVELADQFMIFLSTTYTKKIIVTCFFGSISKSRFINLKCVLYPTPLTTDAKFFPQIHSRFHVSSELFHSIPPWSHPSVNCSHQTNYHDSTTKIHKHRRNNNFYISIYIIITTRIPQGPFSVSIMNFAISKSDFMIHMITHNSTGSAIK